METFADILKEKISLLGGWLSPFEFEGGLIVLVIIVVVFLIFKKINKNILQKIKRQF